MGVAGVAASTPFMFPMGGTVASGIWWQQRVEAADCIEWMVLGGGSGRVAAVGGWWQRAGGSSGWVMATALQLSLWWQARQQCISPYSLL